ncbi:MAG: response regulator [Parcubacteria group bacterium]|nr:response regulator [Parcubacteria group bacterium]
MADKKKKILVAEDDRFLSKIYYTKLSTEGYDVSVASDGEEAVRKTESELPELILLDMVMPKKNGFEVLQDIKANEKTKDIPVIILSNLGQEEDVKRGLGLGANDYLVKTNLSIQEVVSKIKDFFVKIELKK